QVFMEEEYGVLDKIEVQDGEIFDVGANIGLTSLYLARKYPEKKIYAIEPDQSNFGLLCLNVSKVANIIPVNCAVWGDKTHSLFIPDDNSEEYARRTHVKETHGSQKVRAMRIDELMEKYAVEKISILKMDAEGAEQNIFSNNPQQWLNRVSSIVIELHEAIVPGSTKAFRDAIEPCFAEIATTRELTLVSRKEA
ncbi:MAG: FkbM family methyltransferase, partial [Candidatus Accumulibacter sp.]|nr:FkbM family methyltransferase [Accumulibacter sp.]